MAEQRSSSDDEPKRPADAGGGLSPGVLWGMLWARVKRQPIHAALVAASVLMAMLGIGVGAGIVAHLRGPDPNTPTVTGALIELDAGRFPVARGIAQTVLDSGKLPAEKRGAALFVLGAAAAREANESWSAENRRKQHLLAAEYLLDARESGFPEDREATGLYLLATSEFHGERFATSIPMLQEALVANPKHKTELASMLAKAYLRNAQPQFDEALKYNEQYLADKKLQPEQRHDALLERAQIYFRLAEFEPCDDTLKKIPADAKIAAGAAVLRARLRLQEGEELHSKEPPASAVPERALTLYQEAEEALRGVQARDGVLDVAAREALFLLGICLLRQEQAREAEAQFARTRRLFRGTPEGLAAHVEEADLVLQDGRSDEALARYLDLIPEIGPPAEFHNPWISFARLQSRLEGAIAGFRDQGEFAAAAALAEALPPVVATELAIELLAETEQTWAKSLLKRAEEANAVDAARLAAEGRAKFRAAGATYARLAELRRAEREYPDDLWHSAQNHAGGQDYKSALRMLKRYMAEESRERRADALVAQGECYLALHKLDLALPPLLDCAENFRKEPASYRARVVASQVYVERNQLAEAKALLLDNLENESLAPASIEWRDSLFALGKLLHREATDLEAQSRKKGVDSPYAEVVKVGLKDLEQSFHVYQEAAARLAEAVERYPQAPHALEARYLVAESRRQSAKWPRKLRGSIAIETTRAALQRQAREELSAALAEYDPLLKLLVERQEKTGLSPAESLLLRNCYFAKADVLFDLERFEEAIAAYSSATNRFHDQPEALEAFVQIASCYRRMNRPVEARGTLEQAKVVLRRIPADAPFTQTTRYDRGEWTQLLNWLSSL